ncbi:MAG: bifunctional phosphoglucose/phosphomannose isomerase [Chloroflexi bacterium]|nr:bifunctional phosphoglucose/phosphomannose isomerase [Chloroflexota bacterium]
MLNLDDPSVYERLDPSRMRLRIGGLPRQCAEAWERAKNFRLPEDYRRVERVVVLGMGGSAIGGDLLGDLVTLESGPLVWTQRDYTAPPFVDDKTLVIASSYSGQTEETLASFQHTVNTKAKKVVITGGGKLGSLAREHGIPVFPIEYAGEPRSALGHIFLPMLWIAQGLGLISDKSRDVKETVRVLDELSQSLGEGCDKRRNQAKRLARSLSGRFITVYGAGFLSAVARRWKTQLNENSKAWAFFELFPELDHNSIVGCEFPPDIATRVYAVFLSSPLLHTRTLFRYDLTKKIMSNAKVGGEILVGKGQSPLSQMMSLIYLGDYVSYYLAILNGVDPSPVSAIDQLKSQMDAGKIR